MDSSLKKGVLNFSPRCMSKHVSGDTDVDQTAREDTNISGLSTRRCRHFCSLKTYLLVWAVAGIYDKK
jgi:hypothetical protein